jgi:hypothetical protein
MSSIIFAAFPGGRAYLREYARWRRGERIDAPVAKDYIIGGDYWTGPGVRTGDEIRVAARGRDEHGAPLSGHSDCPTVPSGPAPSI